MEDKEQNIDLFSDNYVHSSPNLIYSPVCVPGVGVDPEECESQILEGCACTDGECSIEKNCKCIITYGRNYHHFKLIDEKFEGPVMECNMSCVCIANGHCSNSVVRKGPIPGLEVYENRDGKGKAVRVESDVTCGTFICEYAGEIIGREEAMKRIENQLPHDMNYIFHLKEHLAGGSTIHTIIDPTYIGNIGRYINHSCEPNCVVVPVRIDSLVPRLAIFASCYIPSGEELTFDYGAGTESSSDNSRRKKCLCGKGKCRRFLPYDMSV